MSALSRAWRGAAWLALLVGLVFGLWPEVDIAVSALFYDPERGFPVDQWTAVPRLHHLVPVLGWGLLLGALATLAWARWRPVRIAWPSCRDASALAFAILVGVGLVVNAGLKDHVGRPRPIEVNAFGGAVEFVPAMSPGGPCRRNCSFVSGHAATGFALMAVGSLAGARRRRRWLIVGLAAGLGLGLVRMAQGGHFMSDVLFAGLVMYAVVQVHRGLWVSTIMLRRRVVTAPLRSLVPPG